MGRILNLLNKFKALDTDSVTHQSLEAQKENLTEYNQAQMYSGEDKTGAAIGPDYTPLTVFLKAQKGQPFDRVTLYDTGDFYNSMYVTVTPNTIQQGSTDPKTSKLIKKYGEEIFGLNTPYKKTFIQEHLRPEFRRRIKNATGL